MATLAPNEAKLRGSVVEFGVIFLQQNVIIYHKWPTSAVKQNTHAAFTAKTETNCVSRGQNNVPCQNALFAQELANQ